MTESLCPLCGDIATINESSKLLIETLLAERDLYRRLIEDKDSEIKELQNTIAEIRFAASLNS
jgi:hypothetical protein